MAYDDTLEENSDALAYVAFADGYIAVYDFDTAAKAIEHVKGMIAGTVNFVRPYSLPLKTYQRKIVMGAILSERAYHIIAEDGSEVTPP